MHRICIQRDGREKLLYLSQNRVKREIFHVGFWLVAELLDDNLN